MLYGPATDVVSSDPEIRAAARSYILGMLDDFAKVGVEVIPITPTANMKIAAEAPLEQEWEWARETIRAAAEAGAERGIKIVIEPWNRYETYLINRLDQAVQMARDVDHPNVGVKGDLFHMNVDPTRARRSARPAGCSGTSTWRIRPAPLRESGTSTWSRSVARCATSATTTSSTSNLPAAGDPFLSIKGGGADEFKDRYTEQAITNLRRAVDEAPSSARPGRGRSLTPERFGASVEDRIDRGRLAAWQP